MKGLAVSVALAVGGCAAPAWKARPHDQYFQRAQVPVAHRPLEPNERRDWWEIVEQSAIRPLSQTLSPTHWLARLAGGSTALDVNQFGQVPDSTWYTNRVNRRGASRAEVWRGSDGEPELPFGSLTVLHARTARVTPALIVRDGRGAMWHVKFDPPAYPEMATGAAIIGARLLHLAGYHVPETHLVTLDLERLRLDPRATGEDEYSRDVPMSEADLNLVLTQLNPKPDGTLRALMSRFVPGQHLGPFSFSGVRHEDPNDRLRHDRRRSLRGLWVFAAWLNHVDVMEANTLDTWVPHQGGRLGHVEHYLLDFDSILGSAGVRPKQVPSGYRYELDWREIGKRVLGLGLFYPYWLAIYPTGLRSVGVFEAQVFDPERWRPRHPNPAFDAATARDTYWAGSVLARVTVEHIRAVVDLAAFSEPAAGEWIASVLIARRRAVLQHAFAPVLPLDAPRVEDGSRVVLEDLEVTTGLLEAGEVEYVWQARWRHDAEPLLGAGTASTPTVNLRQVVTEARRQHGAALAEDPFLTITWWRPRGEEHGPRVELHVRILEHGLLPVGLWRQIGGHAYRRSRLKPFR